MLSYHRLRGSTSPVLTATGFVNGKGQFSTPYRSTPLNRSPKNCHRWLRRRVGDPYRLQLCQISCTSIHGGLLGTLYSFLMNSATGQARRQIFTHDSSDDADSRNDVPFVSLVYVVPHLRGQNRNKKFRAWIGVFKPNSRNRKTCILSKLLYLLKPNFAQW